MVDPGGAKVRSGPDQGDATSTIQIEAVRRLHRAIFDTEDVPVEWYGQLLPLLQAHKADMVDLAGYMHAVRVFDPARAAEAPSAADLPTASASPSLLSRLTVVVQARDSDRWLPAFLPIYRRLGIGILVVNDPSTTPATRRLVSDTGLRSTDLDAGWEPEDLADRIETEWMLSVNDDELPTAGLMRFAEAAVASAVHYEWGVPVLRCRYNADDDTVEYSQFLQWSPLAGANTGWRLLSPHARVRERRAAPLDAAVFSFDWIVRTFAERAERLEAALAMPGGERTITSLAELEAVPEAWHMFVPLARGALTDLGSALAVNRRPAADAPAPADKLRGAVATRPETGVSPRGRTVIFTLCSNNYLAQATTLIRSVARHQPDSPMLLGLVDRLDPSIDYAQLAPATVVPIEEIGIPDFDEWRRTRNIIEMNTGAKPTFFKHVMRVFPDADSIVYLDPDTKLFADLSPLDDLLRDNDVVITPHVMAPIPIDGLIPSEQLFLNYGIYNLGFIALRNGSKAVDSFLDWWEERCLRLGFVRLAEGLFVDQGWLTIAPQFFEGIRVLNHHGFNMAPWNVHERRVVSERDGIRYLQDGSALHFYHFSGYRYTNPAALSSDPYNRVSLNERQDLMALYADYHAELMSHGVERLSAMPCALLSA